MARSIVLADEGDSLTSIDWAQIEPVIAANFAQELGALEEYENGSGDLYEGLRKETGVSRNEAKKTLLAQLYGEGVRKLAGDLGVSINRAYEIKDSISSALPNVKALAGRMTFRARVYGKVITLSGRVLPIPKGPAVSKFANSSPYEVHKGINYTIQGSAYDLLAEALISIEEAGLGDAIYLGMHDELVVSSSAADEVEHIMQKPPERLIRLASGSILHRNTYGGHCFRGRHHDHPAQLSGIRRECRRPASAPYRSTN